MCGRQGPWASRCAWRTALVTASVRTSRLLRPVAGRAYQLRPRTCSGYGNTMDSLTHLYGRVIKPDNSFDLQIDGAPKASGSLLSSMSPAVNPPKDIDDPSDAKPADWVEEAKMDDPSASKPDDWDEDQPQQIDDASATKPAGWVDDQQTKIPDSKAFKPGSGTTRRTAIGRRPSSRTPRARWAAASGNLRGSATRCTGASGTRRRSTSPNTRASGGRVRSRTRTSRRRRKGLSTRILETEAALVRMISAMEGFSRQNVACCIALRTNGSRKHLALDA